MLHAACTRSARSKRCVELRNLYLAYLSGLAVLEEQMFSWQIRHSIPVDLTFKVMCQLLQEGVDSAKAATADIEHGVKRHLTTQ
jgi:hypothetical protein